MANFVTKQLGIGVLSTTLTTTLYTVPSATTTEIFSIVLCNTDTVNVRAVTLKAGPATKRTLLAARPLQPGETIEMDFRFCLAAADTLQGGEDAGTTVEYLISGVEIS